MSRSEVPEGCARVVLMDRKVRPEPAGMASTQDDLNISTGEDIYAFDNKGFNADVSTKNDPGNGVSHRPTLELVNYDHPGVEIKPSQNGAHEKTNDSKKKEPRKMVGPLELFRFAECKDVCLMVLGTLMAMGHGASLPLIILFFGQMIDVFADYGLVQNLIANINWTDPSITFTPQQLQANITLLQPLVDAANISVDISHFQTGLLDQLTYFAIVFSILAVCVLVATYIQEVTFLVAAERQIWKIRLAFLRAIMRQDIGWFDTNEPGQLNSRLSSDVSAIKEGLSDKVGNFFQYYTSFVGGVILGFVKGWKLALVIMAASPLLALAAIVMGKLASSLTTLELKAYSKAGAVAVEVLGSIRTVAAFGGEEKEAKRYDSNLTAARKFGIKKGISQGLSLGFTQLVMFLAYALGFWYGAKLAFDPNESYSAGTVILVFFAIVIGAFSLGNAIPNLQSFGEGRGAAYYIYRIIDRVPEIDSYSEEGLRLDTLKGDIKFENITFAYPSRPDIEVMRDVTLSVSSGLTVALVGPSGCGKSTTVQLLQRFYDPAGGKVTLDGHDIRDLNVGWLRRNIGVVSQEPVLFDTTIAENLRYGRDGVTQSEMEAAAKEANAHDFIQTLPERYKTLVGERGAQLSGGQKQRIAIARALVKNPRILLLDEATSALDTESEQIVQQALDKVRQGRTTIVIAHRLSTIQTADRIVAIKDGRVAEQGTHAELMDQMGLYHSLVTTQMKKKEKEKDVVDSDSDSDDSEDPTLARQFSIKSNSNTPARKSIVNDPETNAEQGNVKKAALKDVGMGRLLKMNLPEFPYIIIGCFAALISGGVQPCFAIIFAEFIGVFGDVSLEARENKISIICILFVVLGIVSFVSLFAQAVCFAKSGEGLTERLRQLAFRAMLRQEISYFDDQDNNTGALTARLATESSAIQGASGARLGGFIQGISNMGAAILIAFVYGWRLTLVILAFVPFLVVGGMIQMRVLAGVSNRDKEAIEDASKIAVEAIGNMRTVAQLTREKKFHHLYEERLKKPYVDSLRQAHIIGAVFGVTQCLIYLIHAAAFYFGAMFIEHGFMNFIDVFIVFSAIVFGAMALGRASAFAPDYAKAKVAAANIFALLDRKSAIDSSSEDGKKPVTCSGDVEFKDVRFRYPTRPDITILRGLNVSASSGETVALVGTSGCGKSTTVQLVERFYDVESGHLLIDGEESRALNIRWLRSQIGIVSQEPVLFDLTIRENIAYGDNRRTVDMNEIIEAARKANIHDFITKLPLGYDTRVGDKGTQLSGGQKQRIAIARALLRDPKILLLDEATSALDTESEKVVQEALDKAREGRTCLVIAHRLSTIRNANRILVFHHGVVKESGTHQELIAKKGLYHKLNNAQVLK